MTSRGEACAAGAERRLRAQRGAGAESPASPARCARGAWGSRGRAPGAGVWGAAAAPQVVTTANRHTLAL
ncbi:MAG: hypothetical protein LBE67_14055 [Kocuria palustris]|nr:hypothetical protein [Kocuria palustris]